ncbi:MAG: hypothetical protein WA947_21185 [Phormidesmis sp.]
MARRVSKRCVECAPLSASKAQLLHGKKVMAAGMIVAVLANAPTIAIVSG